MYSAIALLLCVVCGSYGDSPYGYHLRVGVPKAIELLKYESSSSRIIGGTLVNAPSVIPHQVGIIATLTNGMQSICGGALISNTRVLSAAHCWWDGENRARKFTVVLGSTTILTGGTRTETTNVVVHPNWDTNDIVNDLLMVKINTVQYTNNIRAIPLPTNADMNLNFAGMIATVSGYGKIKDGAGSSPANVLYQRSVSIITNNVCQSSLNMKLHGSHLCTSGAGKVGTCDGDSGGPLTIVRNGQKVLVGIVSFGLDEGCAFGNPSAYSRVTSFLAWIRANM